MKREGVIVILLALLVAGCGSNDQPIVARVGDATITSGEFLERYTSYLGEVSQRDNIVLRQKILTNMIHELLVMRDIERQGFDRDSLCERKMEEIREQALLDGYARHISTDTMTVSEDELWTEFRAFNSTASARYLYSRTEAGAWKLKHLLTQGATFEELARGVFDDPGLANNGGYLGSFGWGEMEPALDELVFSLPPGTISDPIRLAVGYAIVKVETRVTNPLASQGDYLKNRDKLAKAIHDRKVVRLVAEEARRITRDLGPVFHDDALAYVHGRWGTLLSSAFPDAESARPGIESPMNVSGMPMVTFRDRSWSVSEFVSRLAATTETQRKRVRSVDDLKEFVLGLATREVLLEKARTIGLDRDSMVTEHVQKGRVAYLLKRWGASVTDTIGASGGRSESSGHPTSKNHQSMPILPR
jgi:parvulin-like peptidyl-prolyl isomerase